MQTRQDVVTRLEQARTEAGLNISELQRRLKGMRVRGASYPNVHAILKGRQVPGVAFLEAAAQVLRVPTAWLMLGEGHETPAAGIVADAARFRAAVPPEDWLRRMTRDGKLTREAAISQWQERQQREEPLLRRAAAAAADYRRHDDAVRAAFKRAFSFHSSGDADEWAAASRPWYYARWRFAPHPEVEIGPAAEVAAARAMGRALAAPLRALGIEHDSVSPWRLRQYVTLVSAALEAVLIGKAELEHRPALVVTIGKSRGRARQLYRERLAKARTPEGRKAADDKRRATLERAATLSRKRDLEQIRIGTTVGH